MEQSTRSKLHIVIVVCIIAILAIAAYLYKHHQNALAHKPAKAQAVIVPLATAKAAVWHQEVNVIGTIAAMHGITLKAEVPGRITKVYVTSGASVKKGDKLIQINPKVYKAVLNKAKANLALAQHNFERFKKLYISKAVSKSQYDQSLYERNADKAAVAHAQAELNLTTIHAPFNGQFGLKQAFLGDYVNVGEAVANLQSDKAMRLDFSIPGRYANQVKLGSVISFHTSANPDKAYQGKVYAMNTRLNAQTRTLQLRASILENTFMPNTFAEVTLQLSESSPVVTVPQTAVVKSIYGDYVYLVKNRKATQTTVTTKARRGDIMGITKGISAGDVVVSGGQNKIHNGSWVTDQGALSTKGDVQLIKPNS